MRTAIIMLSGWVIGGLLVFAMAPHSAAVRPAPSRAGSTASGIATIVIPVAGVRRAALRDTFNDRRWDGRAHEAMDILAPRGTPVLAAVDGTVRKLLASHDGGLTIYEFDVERRRVYFYAHLDRYREGLVEGERVHIGDVIGYVGTTGNAPEKTPHLHFAIGELLPGGEWWKSVAVDPWPVLIARGVTLQAGGTTERPRELAAAK